MAFAHTGLLRKMRAEAIPDAHGTESVRYDLRLDELLQPLDDAIGRPLTLQWSGRIFCSHCGRQTRRSFSQGYCYPCFQALAACDRCMMSPELCHFSQGTCREPEWARDVCFQPHLVYLANSSGLKVGITRAGQVPVRWLDQGAIQGFCLARVDSRHLSGLIENRLRMLVADRTNWRTMLKGAVDEIDLAAAALPLKAMLASEWQTLGASGEPQWLQEPPRRFRYPVIQYPVKVSSHDFDKNALVSGRLMGIKGQYLMLDTGVINLRKFTSYEVSVRCDD